MRAVVMTQPGGPEVLELTDLEEPQIQSPTEIKVRLRAAGVNPIDTKLRGRGVFFDDALPAVLGCDGAGEVVAVGEQAKRFQVGDQVWFCHGGLGGDQGNYAEFKVMDQAEAEFMPGSVDFAHAAAAPLVLITAWEALFDRGHLREEQTVLIHGGAGGVGHVAIQLAKTVGARVITTVSTPEKGVFAQDLGADELILYRHQNLEEMVMDLTRGNGVDLCLDTVGPEIFKASMPLMATYGHLITLLDPGKDLDLKEARNRNLNIGFTLMLTPMLERNKAARQHQNEILRRCAEWMDDGRLRLDVSRSLPLAEAAEAHRLIEEGHTQGKLVLEI